MILVPTPRRTSKSADEPGFLTSGNLLAAPSHLADSGKRTAFVPVTVAGAVPALHRTSLNPSALPRVCRDQRRESR